MLTSFQSLFAATKTVMCHLSVMFCAPEEGFCENEIFLVHFLSVLLTYIYLM